MSRRPPPREYYDEDEIYEMEREREREHRPRRRDRDFEEDDYRRRRSEALSEDMERMHIRERPRRDFMEESFVPREREDMVLRRSRDERDVVSPEGPPLDRDEMYMRPPGSRRRHRPREMDEEDVIFEERERHRGSRRHPRDIEEDLVMEERERHGDRRHRRERERDVDEDLIIDERERRERRRERKYRPERVPEDFIVDEREGEREGDRRRRLDPRFEDDEVPVERESRRGSRRHPREFEEDEMIVEDRVHRGSRRYPERRSEDDLLFEDRERRHRRRRPEREVEEEEMLIRRRERDEPPLRRGWDSELDIRSRERRLEFEEEETYHRSRSRSRPPPPRRVHVEEVVLDDPASKRHRGPIERPEREFEDEDVLIRWKGKGPRPIDPRAEEELVLRGRREKRRSVPSEDLERELRGLRREVREEPPLDEGISTRSQFDPKSTTRDLEDVEEKISIRKAKEKLPSRAPSPSLESIHVLPIHQDVYTTHRHIDHEEDILLKHSDSEDSLTPEDSISPTSGPSMDFHDPWDGATRSRHRRRPKPLDDESEITYREEINALPSKREVEEVIEIEDARIVEKAPQSTDDWSVVHAPSKTEAIEMTGALDVLEVQPRHAPVDEVKVGRVAQQVTEPKEPRNDRWTEIAKRLVVREAIEEMGFEYEETRTCYYIFSYLKPEDIDELVELSDEIRSDRRRRIRDIQRERAYVPPIAVPAPMAPRMRPRVGIPPRARMVEKRMQDLRDREWMMERR
ncbi:hypothetical protein N7457_001716 [Penicillium paradoxum]|uniref:uncharacterized protein n=1 Tax=Penicillium paradoxum TaxID=176176 RepID=UPI0025495825|nr:uncharacterized protein N7457_001716 [Penicillium paradoxum]KAJ5795117.1 hypothetical protein N7457_001716 [Penicillium paradoxum]